MSYRIIHFIKSDCDVYVSKTGGNNVRVRIIETDPELASPTDFEIEGDADHIAEALGTVAEVLCNLEALEKEPN